jgi:hypothetical protein
VSTRGTRCERHPGPRLFYRAIMLGMASAFSEGGVPKYVWAVDHAGEVYEAKTRLETETVYHGYRVNDDDRRLREYVCDEWNRRC